MMQKLKCYNLESKTTGRREGGTKKTNCPAVIRMMEVVKFPQFQVLAHISLMGLMVMNFRQLQSLKISTGGRAD